MRGDPWSNLWNHLRMIDKSRGDLWGGHHVRGDHHLKGDLLGGHHMRVNLWQGL
jgi:hypothetical protein